MSPRHPSFSVIVIDIHSLCDKYGRLLKRLDRRSLDAEVFFAGPFTMVIVFATYIFSLYSFFFPFNLWAYSEILTRCTSIATLITLSILGSGLAYTTKPRKLKNLIWLPLMYLYWMALNFVASYALLQILFKRPKKWNKTDKNGVIANSTVISAVEQIHA